MSISTAFHVTRTGLQLQELKLAVNANNLAKQGADGAKKSYVVTYELPYQDLGGSGATTSANGTISPTTIKIGMGVQAGSVYTVFTPGDPIQTEESLDLMISGEGFFEVLMPDGTTSYTRVGSLQKNPNGQLVLPKTGFPIQPTITIPAGTQNVKVNEVGQVYAVNNGLETLLGQINLAYFMNPTGLDPIGNSMYQATTSSGVATVGTPGTSPLGTIMSGWREGSNINPVEEITDLIQLGKIYEMLTKVLKTGDEMLNATNRVGH